MPLSMSVKHFMTKKHHSSFFAIFIPYCTLAPHIPAVTQPAAPSPPLEQQDQLSCTTSQCFLTSHCLYVSHLVSPICWRFVGAGSSGTRTARTGRWWPAVCSARCSPRSACRPWSCCSACSLTPSSASTRRRHSTTRRPGLWPTGQCELVCELTVGAVKVWLVQAFRTCIQWS